MKAEFILMIFFVALIGYNLYVIYFTLTKKNRTYNKIEDAKDLYDKMHLFNRFVFPKVKFKGESSNYKILKDEQDQEWDGTKKP